MNGLDADYKNVFRTVLIEAKRLHDTEGVRPAFGLLIDQVEALIDWELFDRLDDFLDLVDPDILGVTLVVCVLRSTYRVRRYMVHWNSLLSKVRLTLGDNPDAGRILVGLTYYRPTLTVVKEIQA